MHILNIPMNKGCHSNKIWYISKNCYFPSNLVARQRTLHVLYILSITLLQNNANTLFDTTGEIKGRLLYCFRFEMILNSLLFSQKCRQRERTSLRDGLRLPSNSALKMIRRQLLYVMKPEGLSICV